jgi:N6-adenosine-specific RNA methylase IME4
MKEVAELNSAGPFGTILADPPWRFQNKTGKIAPEHHRLNRYETMTLEEISRMPVGTLTAPTCHLYLWVPNALLAEGLAVMNAWGFSYKTNLVWHKVRKDGGSDGRGVGFYFRNVTELVLFGVKGRSTRTFAPGRRQVNLLASRKREHSRKPDELYSIVEVCSWNSSRAACGTVGLVGAIKPTPAIIQVGGPIRVSLRTRHIRTKPT